MMAKTTRLKVFENTESRGKTGQKLSNPGPERGTIWAELKSRETGREVDDRKEVTKEIVEYLVNERSRVDEENYFKKTKTDAPLFRVKSISFTDDGDQGDRLLRGVRTE